MNKYIIINDEKALSDFIDWLPELQENEKYYCSLFARKKYCDDQIRSNDKTQLKRFTSNKERLIEKIKHLEIEVGAYKLKEGEAPQESLALYITPNPRNMKKATFLMMKKCLQLIENDNSNYNIHAEALSCIQKSQSRGVVVDFDIDTKDVNFNLLKEILDKDSYDILETRGGYHLLVDPRKAPKTNWYKKITEMYPVDQTGDNMIPIPGTYQGGFTPTFLK